MIRWRRLPACVVVCGLLAATIAFAGEPGRSLPFNKQNVIKYFIQAQDGQRKLPENITAAEYEERVCQSYADQLRQAGFDFEATVQNALQFADHGKNKLDDPRFMFLAGVFQVHPDVYLRLKLISKATRDAVVSYFGG